MAPLHPLPHELYFQVILASTLVAAAFLAIPASSQEEKLARQPFPYQYDGIIDYYIKANIQKRGAQVMSLDLKSLPFPMEESRPPDTIYLLVVLAVSIVLRYCS